MKRVLCCLISLILILINCGTIVFAYEADSHSEVPYIVSGSLDYKSKNDLSLSGKIPGYYYLFDNGKPEYNSYDLLDERQKKIYDHIVNAPIGTIEIEMFFDYGEYSFTNFTAPYLDEIMDAISYDCPELFYYYGYYAKAFEYDNTCIKSMTYYIDFYGFGSTYTYENITGYHADLMEAMNSVPVDMSNRYNFVKSVHDYLCKTIYYPDLNSPDYTGNAHDAYGALVEKIAVCQGYAKAFKLICDYYKIPCVCVTGTANGGNHMWNAVQMDDGLWYLIDATWDDQTGTVGVLDDFFLIGLNTEDTHFGGLPFSQSHISDPDMFLPVLKYAYNEYAQKNHFTEFGATYNSIAKTDGKYLIRSYYDVYDSYIYYNGMFVEVESPATNSKFTIKKGNENIEEEWTLVSICDCNGDGLADDNDYADAVNKVVSGTQVTTAFDMAADADCDGYLDVIDLAIIQRAVSGKNTDIVLE